MNNKLKRIMGAACALTMVFACGAMAACNDGNEPVKPDEGDKPPVVQPGDDDNPPVIQPGDDEKTTADLTYELGKNYIISHNGDAPVTYVMEAENTNLGGKHGVGYSGNLDGKDLVITPSSLYNTECSGEQMVNYLYRKGVSLQFFIVSDREVDDAVLSIRLSAEYMDMIIGNGEVLGMEYDYQIRVDQPSVDDLKDIDDEGAWGGWDDYYLKYYDEHPELRGSDCADPYYVKDWECTFYDDEANEKPGIRMNAAPYGAALMTCENFKITSHLKLYKGITCISFITNSTMKPTNPNTGAPLGTMDAVAPVFDCIGIKTSAQIGMFKPTANNNKTDKACFIDNGKVFGND